MSPRMFAAPLLAALVLGVFSGCSAADGERASADGPDVVAGFYPLEYAVEQVGGERVDVRGLTKPGVEPHDLELTPAQVADVADSDLIVHLKGFQPALDEAVGAQAKEAGFDVTSAARLTLPAPVEAEEEKEGENAEEESAVDPHFWLDPKRYADVADAIGAELSRLDRENARAYTTAAADFRKRLEALDAEFSAGLANCDSDELVTSHAAFGYLAAAYGLKQQSIAGLSPESEPSPAALARIAAFVKEYDVSTIYAETLVSQDVARTLAREAGAKLTVLDPVEGLTDTSAGDDYFEVMRSNLAVLKAGQGCS